MKPFQLQPTFKHPLTPHDPATRDLALCAHNALQLYGQVSVTSIMLEGQAPDLEQEAELDRLLGPALLATQTELENVIARLWQVLPEPVLSQLWTRHGDWIVALDLPLTPTMRRELGM